MTSNKANEELRRLYETQLPILISNLKSVDSASWNKFSYPLLPHVFEDYFTSKCKIVFIGKETNGGWGSIENHAYPINDLVTTIISKYINFDFGKDVESNKWKLNSAFWRFCHQIFNSLNDTPIENLSVRDHKRGFVWLNQCRVDESTGTPKKKSFTTILNWSMSLLRQEIEILKPDVIIFIGNSHYRYWVAEDIKERENEKYFADYIELFNQSKMLYELNTNFFSERAKVFYAFHPERKRTEDIESVKSKILELLK